VAWGIASRQNLSYAKELTQPTVQAFAHYVQLTEARMQNEVSDPRQFLYSYTLPEKSNQRFEVYYRFYRHALVSGPEPECAAWLRPRIAETPARFCR
jgi:hypothetical protein